MYHGVVDRLLSIMLVLSLLHIPAFILTCTCYCPPCSGVIGISVYTWGSNSNVTLGHDYSRNHPERLDLSGTYSVSQVCFSTEWKHYDEKLHALFHVFYIGCLVQVSQCISD